jgi:ABC-type transport system involved in Fe-S cluster assembly fused permease/ATPase subunit
MMPSREFKENFVVGGCFTLSLIFVILTLTFFQLWFLLPVFILGWLFVLFQSFRMGVWRMAAEESRRKERRSQSPGKPEEGGRAPSSDRSGNE